MDWKDACEQAYKKGFNEGYNKAVENILGGDRPCPNCYAVTLIPDQGPNYCSECGRKLI